MNRCGGFTYLTALFIVALMGAGFAAVGTMWQTASQRDKESELLFVGNQYRRAIERYYLAGPKRYPRSLEELVKDSRTPATQRHIRRIFPDPITGTAEWGIVKAPDGGIMGVYSRSEEVPLKRTNFKVRDRDFEPAKTYADWKFVYTPATQPTTKPPPPASAPPQPGPAAPTPAPAK